MSYTVGSTRVINTTSSSGTTDFTFTFPYIKEAHIEVYKDYTKLDQGTGAGEYQVITNVSPKLIRLGTATGTANVRVEIRRNSSLDTPLVDYADGSTLTANDLDTSALQSLYIDQELKDSQFQTVTTSESTGLPSLGNKRLTEVADPTAAQDAATKNYVDTQDALQVTKAGDAMTGILAMGTNKVTGVGDPTAAQDAATKNYVDTKVFSSGQLANVVVTTTNITDGTIVAGDLATGTLDGRYYTETELDAGQLDNRYYTETELNAGQLDNRYFTETELTGGALDGRYFTETEADARYFNISSGETIKDGDVFPDNDTTIATTAAINDRIIDLVDDVGGFVPIANETSFPTTNPDAENGTGTLVSIKEFASSHTPSGGSVTIANGAGSGNTVTITGCGSTVLAAGFGGIVETTSTLHTYTFHRLSPKATEVTTVAGISGNITTVAGISANVTTVAGISANVTTVATNNTNVTNVGGSIANVNTVAGNLTNVNNFADLYQIASSDPSTDGGGNALSDGDLYFNSSGNELKVYNGSAWQGGVTATGNLVSKADIGGTTAMPGGNGSAGQYLKTNGSGSLSWASIASDKIEEGDSSVEVTDTGTDGKLEIKTQNLLRMSYDDTGSGSYWGRLNLWGTAQGGEGAEVRFYHGGNDYYTAFKSTYSSVSANASFLIPQAPPAEDQNLTCTAGGMLHFSSYLHSTQCSKHFTFMGVSANNPELRFSEKQANGSNYIGFKAADSLAANVTFTLPVGDGSANQYLQTDGSGSLSWSTVSSVPTTITVADESTDTSCNVAFFTGETGDLAPKTGTNLTFNSSTGDLTATKFTDDKGELRSIPFSDQTAGAYTLVAADAGKCIGVDASGVTIPNSVMAAGDAVTLINTSGSNCTITASVGTLYNSADAATGNRTLAGRGMATIYFKTATEAYIGGGGIS